MSGARPLPGQHLVIFVATRPEDVPPECRRFLSVDGSVPGHAARFDHHVTGEPINLDALPPVIDPSRYDGVATTLADTDAVASVVAVLFGGPSALPPTVRAVLEAASHQCDHLAPHPAHDAETNRLGRGLLDWTAQRLGGPPEQTSQRFAAVCREVADVVATGAPLPYDDSFERQRERARALVAAGRVREVAGVALVDTRGEPGLDPLALYEHVATPVGVFLSDHARGGRRYAVGVNPLRTPRPADLGPALQALAAAEYAHGDPARRAEPGPESENWGGRATVFGSPWNYGSRLTPDEVATITGRALGFASDSD